MSKIGWAASAAVMALGLAGCDKTVKPPEPPGPGPKVDASAPGAPQFSEILAVCPTLPAGIQVVKIRITDVSPKKIGHVSALFASNQDGTESVDKKIKDLPELYPQADKETPTRLDLDLTEFLAKAGDAVLVEVQLADPAASFSPGPAAVTAGNADGARMFCIKDKDRRIDPRSADRVVRFYVRDVESKTPLYGKYNIFLRVKDGPFVTPVVLDPKMHDRA